MTFFIYCTWNLRPLQDLPLHLRIIVIVIIIIIIIIIWKNSEVK
jgi:hypothetical protein